MNSNRINRIDRIKDAEFFNRDFKRVDFFLFNRDSYETCKRSRKNVHQSVIQSIR